MDKRNYTLLDNQIWEDENLSHAEFRVLSYLIRTYGLDYGYSFPLREQIINKCHVNPKTLSKVLKGLQEKSYITIRKHKNKTGWNNIYYIHKYLVASKKEVKPNVQDMNIKEVPEEVKPKLDEAPEAPEDVKPEVEASTNELLVNKNCKLTKKLTKDDIVDINKMDTEKLIQAINQANKKQGNKAYHINYLKTTYRNIENNLLQPHREALEVKTNNYSNNDNKNNTEVNTKPLTRYHNSFNEHYKNYGEDELEAKLLKMQAKRKGLA